MIARREDQDERGQAEHEHVQLAEPQRQRHGQVATFVAPLLQVGREVESISHPSARK